MRAKEIYTFEGGHFVRSMEEDEGYWILDEEGEPRHPVPADVAEILEDDIEAAASILVWFMSRVSACEGKAYQAGRNQGFTEGRNIVRQAIGLDSLDSIAHSLKVLEARFTE